MSVPVFMEESHALELDAVDPLARFRERFFVQLGAMYLDGNSPGLLSRDAEEAVMRITACRVSGDKFERR